jgi:alpha-mannosidase
VAELLTIRIIPWLPWDHGAQKSRVKLAYTWAKRLDALLKALEETEVRGPLHIDGTGDLTDIYLQMHPQAAKQVRACVDSNQIWLGPWYAAPASSLASGECLVRNLLLGAARAKAFGCHPTVCILLPSPLYSSQLPQILRGFGIHTACVPTSTFQAQRWHGVDGSELLFVQLPEITSISQASQYAGRVPCLLLNAMAADVPNVLERSAQSHVMVRGSLVEEILPEVSKDLQVGELSVFTDHEDASRRSHVACGHTTVWPDLRLISWSATLLLERWAEPWATAAWLQGATYPAPYLEKAWVYLLQNQTRDAGGGCQGDSTYRHMRVRAECSKDLAEIIARDHLAAIAGTPAHEATTVCNPGNDESTSLWVVNPLNWPRSEVITVQVRMPTQSPYLQLRSDTGETVPYQLHRVEPTPTRNSRQFTISFAAPELPPMGFRRFEVLPSTTRPYFVGESLAAGNTLENRFLRVSVKANGALRIEDKRTGITYDNCNVFEDSGDAGSLHQYAPPEQDRIITTYAAPAQVSIIENGVFSSTVQVQHNLDLPADLHAFKDPRSDTRTMSEVTSYVTLRRDVARIDIRTRVVNRSRDHRLRVLFSSNIATGRCWVAQPFDVVERLSEAHSRHTPHHGRRSMPKGEFVDISGKSHGLMVASRGLHEYEIKPTPAGTIALTLLRAVRADAAVLQAPQVLEFDYALIPHSGTWQKAFRTAWEFCASPGALSAQELGDHRGGLTAFSIAGLEPAPLLLSAVKRSEDQQAVIIRAYNPTSEAINGKLTTGWPVASAHVASLDETPLKALECHDPQHLTVRFGPHAIVTLRLLPRRQTH